MKKREKPPCKLVSYGGYDYDCKYKYAGEVSCENCICAGGDKDPRTGKKFVRFIKVRSNK